VLVLIRAAVEPGFILESLYLSAEWCVGSQRSLPRRFLTDESSNIEPRQHIISYHIICISVIPRSRASL
jgi:hypothetical protein